ERRHAVLGWPEPIDNGAIGWIEFLTVTESDIIQRRRMPGQAIVSGRVMVLHRMVHAADQGELVRHPRYARQPFTHHQSRGLGRNRLEFTSNRLRRRRLHVERIDMTRPAELMQENDRLGPRLVLFWRLRRLQ